jgi:hypothetical protein
MSKGEFEKRTSEVLSHEKDFKFPGIQHFVQFQTKAGLSSFTSSMGFLNAVDEEVLEQIPDYIRSETLEMDIDLTVHFMAHYLLTTKYFPNRTQVWVSMGATADSADRTVTITDWEDFEIINCEGRPLYTKEILSEAEALFGSSLATALQIIVTDICDEGGMLSEDWYRARIVFEYFREPQLLRDSAFLIGTLYKELCVKQEYDSDLSKYYQKLSENGLNRKRGAETTQKKAEELRDFCVNLFVEMAVKMGAQLVYADPKTKAAELRKAALSKRPEDFMRAGKPYSEGWFLKNIIEDQAVQIVKKLDLQRR